MDKLSHLPEKEEEVTKQTGSSELKEIPAAPCTVQGDVGQKETQDNWLLKNPIFVRQLKQHEIHAWDEFDKLAFGQIHKYMRGLGFNYQTSEDLTQETFTIVFHCISKLKDDNYLVPWMYRIASHIALKEIRKMKRQNEANKNNDSQYLNNATPSKLENQKQLQGVYKAINQLRPKLKEAILLRCFQGLTYLDCATTAGVSIQTFKGRLHRAKETLINILTDWEERNKL